MSATLSWGANPSTPSGLESNLWGISTSTSSSAANSNSSWGSVNSHASLSTSQGHNMQVGASSGGDAQSTNGSASSGGWGLSSMSQNGSSVSATLAQSQAGSLPSSNTVQQSGPNSLSSGQSGPFGSSQMPWQGSKMFGIRDFPQSSDSGWSGSVASVISSSGSGKDTTAATVGGELDGRKSVLGSADSGRMDLAAGLQNLAIDKSNPPPDINWNAAKAQWNSSSAMDPSSIQGAGIGNPADLSFAQATQKGIKPQAVGSKPAVLSAKDEEIRRAIDTHDGWGSRPIRQDTSWDIDSSPKTARKVSVDPAPDMGASNVWNNNNGTAIWEAVREPQSQGWQGGAAGGGNIFGGEKDPNNWNMPPKPGMDGGSNWGGGGGGSSLSDKSIGTWGGEQQPSKLWGSKTETGSWNEPPNGRNTTWSSQDTDVGTWEDPATAASRRIVSGGGMSVGGGNGMNMGMGGGSGMNMGMGGGNSMNMGMGGGGSGMNMGMGGGNGMNMGMGGGGMNSGMNMPVGGGGGNMNMPMGGNGMGDSSLYWNDPNAKPQQSWNPAAGPPRPKPDEPWNKQGPGAGRQPGGSGWGDPSGGGQKADDGTSIWAANAQEQARAAGWGEPSAVWNPAVGARPKSTSWVGDADSWNLRKPGWTDEAPSHRKGNSNDPGWGEVEVGYWNDVAQESSSWTSAPTWKSGKGMMVKQPGQQRFPGGSSQPQMRSKLIQQLMDMGFKKEEAQSALISNNMNFESALAELTSGTHKRDYDNDVFQPNGAKFHRQGFLPDGGPHMVGDDISDSRADSNPHVPNFPMQNTPFPNAQVPSQPFMSGPVSMYDRSKGGPPMPPASSSSINSSNLQHKLKVLQQQGNAAPGINSLNPNQGVVTRGGAMQGTTQTMVQQQAAQQQILQQLRLAVQSGLISPHLLNRQLPHNILVMLQQLLQLQNSLQNLMQRQQFLHQNKVSLNIPRPQLDQVSVMITQCKSQILSLQKQLEQAQHQMLLKEQPPPTPTPTPTPQQMQQLSQQPPMVPPPVPTPQSEVGDVVMSLPNDASGMQSRLNQWKQTTPERGDGDGGDLNKAPGSKLLAHSHSTPTLGPFGDLTSLNIGGDQTWSANTSGATNWPSTSTSDSTSGIGVDSKSDDGTPPAPSFAAAIGGEGSLGLATDVIPEFVPGKPWQGLSSKSVEDDPHITPGSISRSLSVNVVKDDYLNNLTANKSSPAIGDTPWSLGNMKGDSSHGANRISQWQGQAPGSYGRQNSWAGRSMNSAFNPVSAGSSSWDSRWLTLKNLTSQIDAGTLRTLCQQHGPLLWFSLNSSQAVVSYTSREEAAKALKALHGCALGNTLIQAEFLPETEAMQLINRQMPSSHTSMVAPTPPPSSQWGQSPSSSTAPSGYPWNSAPPMSAPPMVSEGGSVWGSSLWDAPGGDQGAVPSLSNILGGEPM
ncbi:hypothetical protein BaRGS_00000860 [Batillaria attramentaria]|uniref:UBA domain-containing protein n=1 Tax=Batillaria attramentaria TaxID=370345 RepID=A0ABD0M826_9CAEN